MPILEVLKSNFVAGELSPQMRAMTDLARYKNGARLLRNWQVLTTGGVTRRAGTRYVATAGNAAQLVVLKPFEPSTSDAYVLEFGHLYMRVYKDSAYTGIQIATPYTAADLRLLRTAQSNDVMLIVHPNYAPRRLARVDVSTFELSLVPFYPPPTFEAGMHDVGAALTLSATTGSITITAASVVFAPSDVQRQLTAGVGRAIITGYTSGTVLQALVIDAFSSTSIGANDWTLRGSPVAQATPDVARPVGATVVVTLGEEQPDTAELLDQDFTNWANYSGLIEVASGTATNAAPDPDQLEDSGADFITAGVQTTQTIRNVTDDSSTIVSSVSEKGLGTSQHLLGGAANTWTSGDDYLVQETGFGRISGGTYEGSGGTAGHFWIEKDITVTPGLTYQVTFTVSSAPMALQVGSATKIADLYPEASFQPGEHKVTFKATGASAWIQFRNNQNVIAGVSKPSVRVFTIDGFRGPGSANEEGHFLRIHNGLIRIRTVNTAHELVGEIVRELNSTDAAAAGAWSIEEPSWSDTLGWPGAVVLYEGRLYLAGSAQFPQTLWGSAVNSFFDFFTGIDPADGVEFSIVDSGGNITLNRITWLMPAENMLVGTSHGEYRLIGSGDDPISAATPPRVRLQSTYGSGTLVPIKVDQALIFPQRQGSKLREIAFDMVFTTRFQVRDLSVLSGHLLQDQRILEIAYAPEPISTVFGVRDDGVMLCLTYDLPEQVVGWWRFETAGVVESVAVIPHPARNSYQVWLVVQRTINGSPTRFIEYVDLHASMTIPATDEEDEVTWSGLTVDAGVVYTGAATATLTGLGHLNGEAVDIVGDGAVFPQQAVTGGQVVLSDPVSYAFAGLHYDVEGETLSPELNVRGSIQDSLQRWTKLTALLHGTVGLRLQGETLDLRQADAPMDEGVRPATGAFALTPFGWDREGIVTFAQPQPLPATVLGIVGLLDVEADQDVK